MCVTADRFEVEEWDDRLKMTFEGEIRDFMCTWEYLVVEEEDLWSQFDFSECLVIEFEYQAYKKTCDDKYKIVTIGGYFKGIIHFDGPNYETGVIITDSNGKIQHRIRRSQLNMMVRGSTRQNRHDPSNDAVFGDASSQSLSFISPTDLEWLSINYRKVKYAKLSGSKRRMILIMFDKEIHFFPTMQEIRDQLLKAMIFQLEKDSDYWDNNSRFEAMKKIYMYRWSMLFDLANLGDLDKPLTTKILSNPDHKITKHILFLYSMESFIYADLNKATRDKDEGKINFYGAYAAALSYIIYTANKNRKIGKLQGTNILYRGLRVSPAILQQTFRSGARVHLAGYTSTSKSL